MADAAPSRIKVYTVALGKLLDALVLCHILHVSSSQRTCLRRSVLNVVVERKDGLLRVVDGMRTDGVKSVA
jgi:hypothetical protein